MYRIVSSRIICSHLRSLKISTVLTTVKPSVCWVNSIYHTYSDKKDNNVLVYEGPLKRRVKWVKLLSLSSSMCAASMFPFVIKDMVKISPLLAVGATLVSSVFLSTPLFLHWITKRYVIELNFNSETKVFTAKTYNLISREEFFHFTAEEVKVPDVPGFMSSFVVRDRGLFVDYRLVKDADVYGHMMGYDKPFDFQLEEEREQKKQQ